MAMISGGSMYYTTSDLTWFK